MGIPEPGLACYLVEWYSPEAPLELTVDTLEHCAAAVSAEGSPVRLVIALAAPTDEVVFGLFAAQSAHVVARTCQLAGLPAQRLTAVDTRPAGAEFPIARGRGQ